MSVATTAEAIKDFLDANITGNNLWPNLEEDKANPVSTPYLDIEWVGRSGQGAGLTPGSRNVERGKFQITVVTEYGTNEVVALSKAAEIEALLPLTHKIATANEVITVVSQPEVRSGFRSGSEWRTPVVISYVSISTGI